MRQAWRSSIVALAFTLTSCGLSQTAALAQDGGPQHHFDRGGPMMHMGGHHFMSMGPDERWWDNPQRAQALGVTPEQRKKMDSIFEASRLQLVDAMASLEKAEIQMEPLMSADQPDEKAVLAQIDRVAQSRAELEKSHARLLLDLRAVLTRDQWIKLKAEREQRRSHFEGGPGSRRGGWDGPPHGHDGHDGMGSHGAGAPPPPSGGGGEQ